MKPYKDLAHLPEDDRIDQIGRKVTVEKMTVGVFVDDKKKADRYIGKLLRRFPELLVISSHDDVVPPSIFIKVGPKPPAVKAGG